MFDLLLRGATVVGPSGMAPADVAIVDGRIAALLRPGEPAEARTAVDLSGKLLLPGLIDAHVHFRDPGMTWKEDFSTGTKAAILGGVTTALVMPTDDPWTVSPADLAAKRTSAEGRIFCDVGLQVATERPAQDVEALVAMGAVSFEVFTSDVPFRFRHDSMRALDEAVRAISAGGGRICVSPGDQSLLEAAVQRLTPDRSTPGEFIRSRPPLAEVAGISAAVAVAAAHDAPVHLRQTSSARSVEALRRVKTGANVTLETGVQGLIFTGDDYDVLGPMAKASPPWRTAEDRQALRDAVGDGTIDIIVTDHAPHLLGEKLAFADDFANVPGGFPGVQTLLPVLLSLVDEGAITLPDLVRLAAARPAGIFGLGNVKGRVEPGFDADLIVIDPMTPMTIPVTGFASRSDYSPFAGRGSSASLVAVYLRGRHVAGAGAASVQQPHGLLVG